MYHNRVILRFANINATVSYLPHPQSSTTAHVILRLKMRDILRIYKKKKKGKTEKAHAKLTGIWQTFAHHSSQIARLRMQFNRHNDWMQADKKEKERGEGEGERLKGSIAAVIRRSVLSEMRNCACVLMGIVSQIISWIRQHAEIRKRLFGGNALYLGYSDRQVYANLTATLLFNS